MGKRSRFHLYSTHLATLYFGQGQFEKAESMYARARQILEKGFGEEHPSVATAVSHLAGLYVRMERYEVAESLYKPALIVRENRLGESHPEVGKSLKDLAGLYMAQGRYAEAKAHYRRAFRTGVLRGPHPIQRRAPTALGIVL